VSLFTKLNTLALSPAIIATAAITIIAEKYNLNIEHRVQGSFFTVFALARRKNIIIFSKF
tara:strand:+ start:358 stop:537 length:180 start_codon:yes stop_codon:yes gene_type:complete